MNGLNKMNQYKEAWLLQAHMLLPPIISRFDQDEMPRYHKAASTVSTINKAQVAGRATIRATGIALTLSAIDGPLPIMDTIALGYWTIAAVASWAWLLDDLFD